MVLKKTWILIFSLLFCVPVHAQEAIGVRYVGVTIHPFGDPQAKLQPLRFDKHAYAVLNIGVLVSYEKFIWEDLVSVKAIQGFFLDCSAGNSGLTHLGVRGKFYHNKKSAFYFGIGPVFYYREDWNRFADYESGSFFNRSKTPLGPAQYKLFWYGAELEWDQRINDRLDFNFAFTPGIPLGIFTSFGIKYWLKKEFKKTVEFYIPK